MPFKKQQPITWTLDKYWAARAEGYKPKFYIMCKDCKELKDVGPYIIEGNKNKRKYCEDCI